MFCKSVSKTEQQTYRLVIAEMGCVGRENGKYIHKSNDADDVGGWGRGKNVSALVLDESKQTNEEITGLWA